MTRGPGVGRRGATLVDAAFAAALGLLVVGLCVALTVRSRQLDARTGSRLDQLSGSSRAVRVLGSDWRQAHLEPGRPPTVADGGRELTLTVCRGLSDGPGRAIPTALVTYRFEAATGALWRREGAGAAGSVVARLPAGSVSFAVSGASPDGVRIRACVRPAPLPGGPPVSRVSAGSAVLERLLFPPAGVAGGSIWSLPP